MLANTSISAHVINFEAKKPLIHTSALCAYQHIFSYALFSTQHQQQPSSRQIRIQYKPVCLYDRIEEMSLCYSQDCSLKDNKYKCNVKYFRIVYSSLERNWGAIRYMIYNYVLR